MGSIDDDKLLTILLFNGLRDHYACLQTSINDMFTGGTTTSDDVVNRLLLEEQVLNDNATISPTTALAAVNAMPPHPVCANCKRPSHRTEFCIGPGGQMAGKTIEEARAAQDAACGTQRPGGARPRSNRAPTPAPAQNEMNAKTLTVNGQCYMLVTPSVNSNSSNTPLPVDPSSAYAAISMPSYDEEEYMAVLATVEDPKASLDWDLYS